MTGARNSALIRSFAAVLREARQKAGLTQEALADAASVDRTYVGLLENGRRQPSLSAIFAIASALEMTPELLVRRTAQLAIGAQGR